MTRDNGYFSYVSVYRHGGAVVRPYCQDPPPLVAAATGDAIVAWLQETAGLEVQIIGRSVGIDPAWQLDLRVDGAPSCAQGKAGLIPLWTVDGRPEDSPEVMGEGDQMRAYVIGRPNEVIIIAAAWRELDDPETFLAAVEGVFSSLSFE